MKYTIKEIASYVEISEQGLYKRIKTNYKEYLKKGFIVLNQVEQPNGTKEQIFLTDKGLEDLLHTKKTRRGATLRGLVTGTKALNQVEQPPNQDTKPEDVKTSSNNILNLLNQTISDLKEENKRLNEKLDKQEARFDKKLEEQKQEFKEQYEKQQELYQKTLDRILQSFNSALLELPKPNEAQTKHEDILQNEPIKEDAEEQPTEDKTTSDAEEVQEEIQPEAKGIKRLFKNLFRGGKQWTYTLEQNFWNLSEQQNEQKKYGRLGGIKSGIVRKQNADRRKAFENYCKARDYINALTDTEFNELMQEFTEEEQERIRYKFRPNKEDQKKLDKETMQYFKRFH